MRVVKRDEIQIKGKVKFKFKGSGRGRPLYTGLRENALTLH
jgi:hypothetical protein